jgi:hypothetical protein
MFFGIAVLKRLSRAAQKALPQSRVTFNAQMGTVVKFSFERIYQSVHYFSPLSATSSGDV